MGSCSASVTLNRPEAASVAPRPTDWAALVGVVTGGWSIGAVTLKGADHGPH
jgi:hypothetical protein